MLPCRDCDELEEHSEAEYGHHDSKKPSQPRVACGGEPLDYPTYDETKRASKESPSPQRTGADA